MADMTPGTWVETLDARLTARWDRRMREPNDYFDGRHPMAFATSQFREAFGSLFSTFADNWCQIVVQSSARRLRVQGFRFGPEGSADKDAWAIWQANGLDAEAKMLHTESIKLGEAYWLIEPPRSSGDAPRITCEHPKQMIVAHAAGDRRRRLAAFKRWIDDEDGYAYATLYLPQYVYKYRSEQKAKGGRKITWMRRPGDEGGPNPLGIVPAVPACNEPTMLGGGTSDIAPGIPLQRAIDKLCADMIVASEYAAFRQRVMTGVELPPEGTEARQQVIMGVNRLLTVEAPDAKVYDLAASDLKNYVNAIEMFIQHLAAQTNTPPHYLLGQMLNVSGDALAAAESGLVSKVEDKKLPFGEAHEDAIRLAFLSIGDMERAGAVDAETLWAPSERRSFAQIVDGAVKLAQIGMPSEIVMEELGYSPQKIARVQAAMISDGLFGTAFQPPKPDTASTGGNVAVNGATP